MFRASVCPASAIVLYTLYHDYERLALEVPPGPYEPIYKFMSEVYHIKKSTDLKAIMCIHLEKYAESQYSIKVIAGLYRAKAKVYLQS